MKRLESRIIPNPVRMMVAACIVGLQGMTFANAQLVGKAKTKSPMPVLTKEGLFEGAGLSAEKQNKVLGNLIKHYQLPGSTPDGRDAMRIPGQAPPGHAIPVLIPLAAIPPAHVWVPGTPLQTAVDPCVSVANERQLAAMHRLIVATLSSRLLDQQDFSAKVPKECDSQRLRYYLNVTAQLFPSGDMK